MWRCKLVLFVVLAVWTIGAAPARILAVFPSDAKSHYIMYGTVMSALADRGHRVTVASQFVGLKKNEKMKEISLENITTYPLPPIEGMLNWSSLENANVVIEYSVEQCQHQLKHPIIMDLVKPDEYDLFITEVFGSDCFLAIGQKLGIPSVGMMSSTTLPWMNGMVANPENPAYVPLYFLPFSDKMNFFQRVINTVATLYIKLHYEIKSNWMSQKFIEDALGPTPLVRKLSRNYSLILVNSHLSISGSRPWVPQAVEVGGLHIPRELQPLPEDLKKFLDESEHGVVYFNYGTNLNIETLPENMLRDVIDVLGSLKQQVLWKVNATQLPPLPSNIRTGSWLPQLSILCHPAIKVFISHGGLLGVQEAINCGVPILGTPIFADQGMNLVQLRDRGAGLLLPFYDINKKTLSEALDTLLNDESFIQNARYYSKIFKERPQHPLDAAIYWIEYVVKFNGARHLRSAAHDLAWYQYLLLDVVLFLIISMLIFMFIIFKIMRIFYFLGKNFATKVSRKQCNLKKKQ